jgi:hypothetical protein
MANAEPGWVSALRLALLLGFVVALLAMAPKCGYMLTQPATYPPGLGDYRLARLRGIEFWRERDARGQLRGYAGIRCTTVAGGARGWAGVRPLGELQEASGRGSPSGGE